MSAPVTLWILGAQDAEMNLIEALLRECKQEVHYAIAGTGRRVAPGQPATSYEGAPEVGPEKIISIEVAGPWGAATIDHHDDAERATWGPERFLEASSIGQVIQRLAQSGMLPTTWRKDVIGAHSPAGQLDCDGQGYLVWGGLTGAVADGGGLGEFAVQRMWRIPADLVYEAAADHCPAAACSGACPGVDGSEGGPLRAYMLASRRETYAPQMSAEEFEAAIAAGVALLRNARPHLGLDPYVVGEQVGMIDALTADTWGLWHPGVVLAGPRPEGTDGMLLWYGKGLDDGSVPVHRYSGGNVGDLTHLPPGTVPAHGSGEVYPEGFLCGPLCASFADRAFVAVIRRRDGTPAIRMNGAGRHTRAGEEPIRRFAAQAEELFGVYGATQARPDNLYHNAVRGFAGGTIRQLDDTELQIRVQEGVSREHLLQRGFTTPEQVERVLGPH